MVEGLDELRIEPTVLSAVTASEMLQGLERSDAKHRPKREAFVEGVLRSVDVAAFDLRAARTHARLAAQLAAKGTLVGVNDLLIAATAIGVGYRVVTRDLRSFPRIPGLDVKTL